MVSVRYGGRKGKRIELPISGDMLVVRTDRLRELRSAMRTKSARNACEKLKAVAHFGPSAVSVYRLPIKRGAAKMRDRFRRLFKKEKAIRYAGRVLRDKHSDQPVVYTENLFVKFAGEASNQACKKILKEYGLRVKEELEYKPNAFFVAGKEGIGLEVFKLSESLIKEDIVELCHPELIRQCRPRAAFKMQWHLMETSINGEEITAHASVKEAWSLSKGKDVIIAIIDDGMDTMHEEFRAAGKIFKQYDFENKKADARPKASAIPTPDKKHVGDAHGTACAGVACANGTHKASGVAPKAILMPLRIPMVLGSMSEHKAFVHAAKEGAHVISCSWGPKEGSPKTQLPDSTNEAINFCIDKGRDGNGCVIVWAAGNGNESVQKDPYASNKHVIAVAACNDKGERAAYSDHGKAIWCAFPSNDPTRSVTNGIWTTDRSGVNEGYNSHNKFFTGGDNAGNYTDGFGGTSSAAPGVAGVVALMLSKNPDLKWDKVKQIISKSCDKIDFDNANYDPTTKHSRKLGYGRINAKKAVTNAAATS